MKEVIGGANSILSLHDNFGSKLQIKKLRSKLGRRFETYNRARSKADLVTARLDSVPRETLRESLRIRLVDATIMKRKLKEAFNGSH